MKKQPTEKTKMLNILYCGNDKVFDGIFTSALSVVMRLDRPRPVNFYIFTMSLTRVNERYTPLTKKHCDILERELVKHNEQTTVTLYDITDLYETHLHKNANENCYCSPYTLLRLFADCVSPALPDKLLYLDADIMAVKDVSLLFDLSVDGFEYLASRDHYGKFLIYPNYINAGVLLFNMPLCKQNGLFEKARALIKVKKLMFADQSAIIRSTTRRKVVSQRFNDQKFLYKGTVIRHFSKRLFYLPYPHTENIKQWQVDKVKKKFGYTCFDDIYLAYNQAKANYEKELNYV